jgi:sulfonate transport system substrate-binding protein
MRVETLLISLVSSCVWACTDEASNDDGADTNATTSVEASETASTSAIGSSSSGDSTGSSSGSSSSQTSATGSTGSTPSNSVPNASIAIPSGSAPSVTPTDSGAGGVPDVPPDDSAIASSAPPTTSAAPTASSSVPEIDGGLASSNPQADASLDDGPADDGPTDAGPAGDAGPLEPLPELTISSDTNSIEFTPALYAAENLYPGVATVITGGIPTLLSDDSVDLGTNAETQTLRRSVERPDLRIIFTVTETFYRVIARRSAGIDSIEDLAGKTIGTPSQTSAAYYVYKTLGLAGLEIGDGADQVTVSSVFPGEQMVTALAGENPTVDAIAAWEPYPQMALDELGGEEGDAIVFQDRSVYREIVNLHSTTAKLDDPVIRRGIVYFVRSLMDSAKWYRDNPAAAQQYVADELGHDADLMARVWPDEQFAGVLADDLVDVLEVEEVWLAEQENREPRTREELAPLVDTSIVEEALALP